MKISRVVWMMVLGFSMSVIAAAQPQGPPANADPVNCTGCVGTKEVADGAVLKAKVANKAIDSSKIDSAEVQRRVAGSCAIGSSISGINEDGTVVCEADDVGITAVTASAPLISSGGNAPNLSLPGVIVEPRPLWANTALGYTAFGNNNVGTYNTAVGYDALAGNTSGNGNTATGAGALLFNTIGNFNTANGVNALRANYSGSGNTATGLHALWLNITGNGNTGTGTGALYSNTTGSSNTATGGTSLYSNTTGEYNTASGNTSLYNNTTGHSNTASGHGALGLNTTGNFNTAVGVSAGVASDNLSNTTAIGAGAVVDASDKIRLGNTAVTVIEAQVGLTVVSDANKKENFQPVDGEAVLHKIQGLSLTSWNLIGQDPKHFRHYGPIAQEFFAAFGSDGVGTIGNPTTITSTDMDGILMVAAQALEKRTAAQTEEVSRLKTENATLKARLETLETLIREILPHR